MKYIRIPFLINTYPQTGNYISNSENNFALFGRYADINKIDFPIPSLSTIKVVDGTRFRNIIAIYKDQQDSSPKYYTSEFYSRDLEASKIESNPYFINESINPSTIVKIYIKDIIGPLETIAKEENRLNVKFIRNNFILFDASGLEKKVVVTTKNQTNLEKISIIDEKLKKLELGLGSVDRELSDKPLFNSRRQRHGLTIDGERFELENPNLFFTEVDKLSIKQKISRRINQLESEKTGLKSLEDGIQSSNVNKFDKEPLIKINSSKIDDDVKQVLDKVIGAKDNSDIIEVDGKFIDCVYLIKYLDWMFSKPTFEEVETGNVIPAEKLSVFKTNDVVQTEESQNDSQSDSSEKRYFTYEIARLSIPATLEQSVMTYRDQFGITQSIRVDKYGFVREICAEEGSWGGAFNLFQKTQLGPCVSEPSNTNNTPISGGGGGGRMGIDLIDYNRDQDYIVRGEAARQNIQ